MMSNGQVVFILALELLLLLSPCVACLIDYRVGIRKAKERGEPIESDKMKLTPRKIVNYLLLLFALSVVDVVQMALVFYLAAFYGWDGIPMLPILTAVGSMGECAIEVKSVYEKNDVKALKEAREVAKMAAAIAKARGDVSATADAVINYMEEKDEHD